MLLLKTIPVIRLRRCDADANDGAPTFGGIYPTEIIAPTLREVADVLEKWSNVPLEEEDLDLLGIILTKVYKSVEAAVDRKEM